MLHEGDLLQVMYRKKALNVGYVTHVENGIVTVFWMRSGMAFEYSNYQLESFPHMIVFPKQD